ncbi:DUF4167 domain-containing protein [Zavarzinia sp. CC-PAN008]|uniref:DUF4167 domain-containing protein n=1 Tax=Zavarzinia sp. CC-PAN008 TaxID=3243332 RepID=UPI003F743EB0
MRPGHPNNKRPRGGRPNNGRKPQGGGGGGGGGGPNRSYDSSGPDVKIRGTASHIYDRYQQLARDAHASGDRIAAENFLQHAEHYYRLMVAAGVTQNQRNNQAQQNGNGGQGPQPEGGDQGERGPAESEMEAAEGDGLSAEHDRFAS